MRFVRFVALYRRHFRDHRRERMVLASLSFFLTFATTRLLVHRFHDSERPLEIRIDGIHLHHFVWGIALLLLVGYLWLIQVGTGATADSHRLGRVTSLLYGIGAALTLDEFALWLHLEDVYWEPMGRASVDAVILFGALVSVGVWGGPFWRASGRQLGRVWRHATRAVRPAPAATPESVARRLEEMLLHAAPERIGEPAEAEPVLDPPGLTQG